MPELSYCARQSKFGIVRAGFFRFQQFATGFNAPPNGGINFPLEVERKSAEVETKSAEGERKSAIWPLPMNHLFLIVLTIFALCSLVPMIFRLFRPNPRDKVRKVVEYAQKRGFVLVNPAIAQALDNSFLQMLKNPALRNSVRAASDITDIEGLENGTGDWLAFTCTIGSKEVTIFNFNVTPRSPSASGGNIRYKVAKIRALGLPQFSLGTNSAIHTLENVVDKISGTPRPAIELNRIQYPEFTAHYWLRGSDRAAVTAFFSPNKIRFIETTRLAGTIATNANYLVYFEDGVLVREEDFDSFIARVEKMVANLL
ncbi:MAG TPA: hypothetical protein VFO39_16065 [Candidatus Sulfotelmatobacter sp.]|nr:hypothetical protein [Candidatus Sulfotelmatobacter sp.]